MSQLGRPDAERLTDSSQNSQNLYSACVTALRDVASRFPSAEPTVLPGELHAAEIFGGLSWTRVVLFGSRHRRPEKKCEFLAVTSWRGSRVVVHKDLAPTLKPSHQPVGPG